ncbi:gentisate 1,2-dioxygenase [Zalerion maritima]|uniref:Gentisate 1,2-dioxygenase n=1 Tax=Zalerion maritima TaxID=339359 RepID=A0AAD5RKV7_9PEZI|nr:gentisate 1,2-dioxygenase [Zalerion maritima]
MGKSEPARVQFGDQNMAGDLRELIRRQPFIVSRAWLRTDFSAPSAQGPLAWIETLGVHMHPAFGLIGTSAICVLTPRHPHSEGSLPSVMLCARCREDDGSREMAKEGSEGRAISDALKSEQASACCHVSMENTTLRRASSQLAIMNGRSSAEAATHAMLDGAASEATKPLWTQMARLNPPAPNPKAVPTLWKYDSIRPHLMQAGKLVPEQLAERRVLMLVNPGREEPYTTDTLYAGLQLVMPGETAKAHRHAAFAMRFIIEGEGGFTAVQGSRIKMKRGDVILTPTWNWHDHGNGGSKPMIWLDGLDLPSFIHFPVHFVEHYNKPRYPAEDVDTSKSPLVFPWERMQKALDSKGGDWVSLPYLKADGSEVSKILGGSAARLAAGKSSPSVQETASSVYHIIEGRGYSMVGGKKIEWKRGDTLAVPAWNEWQHFAGDGETVYLYRFDDKPMISSLGFYRTKDTDVESLISN